MTTQQSKEAKPMTAPAAKLAGPSIHTSTAAAAAAESGAAAAEKEKRTARKVYIVTEPFHEFKSTAEAEKFLNSGSDQAPRGAYTVIKGIAVEQKQRVSLR